MGLYNYRTHQRKPFAGTNGEGSPLVLKTLECREQRSGFRDGVVALLFYVAVIGGSCGLVILLLVKCM